MQRYLRRVTSLRSEKGSAPVAISIAKSIPFAANTKTTWGRKVMIEPEVMLRIKAMELLSQILELVTLEAEYGSIDSLDNIINGTEEIYQYLKEGKTNVGT